MELKIRYICINISDLNSLLLVHFQSLNKIEYILIDGVNDSMNHAKNLAKILSGLACKINLIPFNPFDGCDYKRSNNRNIEAFKKHLFDKGYITTLRITRGDDIDGACGQLVGNLKKATKGKKVIEREAMA